MQDILKNYSWSYLYRSFSFIRGPITTTLILLLITQEEQGFFSIFVQIGILAFILEGGISSMFLFLLASERKKFKSFDISTDKESKNFYRLANLLKRYIIIVPVITFLVVLPVGLFTFSSKESEIDWLLAWLLMSIAVSIQMILILMCSLLDGMDRINEANKYKFISSFVSAISLWVMLYFNFGLLSLPLSILAGLSIALILVWRKVSKYLLNSERYDYKNFFKGKIFRFQVKSFLSLLFGSFLIRSGPSILIFYFLDPSYAAKFAITYVLFEYISIFSLVIFNTNLAKYTKLYSQGDIAQSKRNATRDASISIGLNLSLGTVLCILLFLNEINSFAFQGRFLNYYESIILLIFFTTRVVIDSINMFFKVRLDDYFFKENVLAGSFFTMLLISTLNIFSTTFSVTVIMLLFNLIVHLPLMLLKAKKLNEMQ